jgi:hypothetical protein
VAVTAIALAIAMVGFARVMAALAGQEPLKATLRGFDLLGLTAQLSLAGGSLAMALAACFPGRDRLGTAGAWAAAAGAGLLIAGIASMLGGERLEPLSRAVLQDTALCALNSFVPALVLAVPLLRFVALATPRHRDLALFTGIFAAASFACAPANLGCVQSGALHGLLAHLLAPLLSAGLVFGLVRRLDPGVRIPVL